MPYFKLAFSIEILFQKGFELAEYSFYLCSKREPTEQKCF
jgi:hypothetical protein